MHGLLEIVNFAGDRWAAWAIGIVLDSVVLLALAGLIWLVIRKRVAPQVGYCLFLLLPLKVLVPVSVSVPPVIARWIPSVSVSPWFDGANLGDVRIRQDIHEPATSGNALRPSSESARPPAETDHASQRTLTTGNTPTATSSLSSARSASRTAVPAFTRSPRLSSSAFAAIVWLACVLFLLVRLALTQFRFRARLRRSSSLGAPHLPVNMNELCRIAGVTRPVQIVEDDGLAAPAVWGLLRPTIILPRNITSTLTASQLKWVLLHELAHVRRRDLVVVVLQRVAAILHFFNPAVWLANRMVDQLREYACDDLALAQGNGTAIESGEAFLQVLRHANRPPQGLVGALGVFGLDSRSACFLRVQRLLDSDRPIRTRSNVWALCGLMLLAAVALPNLRAANDGTESPPAKTTSEAAPKKPPQPPAEISVTPEKDPAKSQGQFELKVVGPDGRPIPAAPIEIRSGPGVKAEQIVHGKFVKYGTYGIHVLADAEGRFVVKLPQPPRHFDASITLSGFAPYCASWSSYNHPQPIPASFTAELDAGWSAGGIVVDEAGVPLAGVDVHPSVNYKRGGGDLGKLGMGASVQTDAAGKWRFDSVPISKNYVYVEINHTGFMPNRRPLKRSEFGIEPGQAPANKIVLQRGQTVTGTVTDEAGKPIAGALIRTQFFNVIREAQTDKDGNYQLAGCEPVETKIIVSAKGQATDKQKVLIQPSMKPVNFQMQPGGHVRVQVLDHQGQPVPKARILFQNWRGAYDYFQFENVNQYADQTGTWEWNEAPLDQFTADICPPDGMYLGDQPLLARAAPYIFRLPPPLIISGRVIDAATKQPIKKFQIILGYRVGADYLKWQRDEQYVGTDGSYSIRATSDYFAHLVRVEADGYLPADSRDIKSNEGEVTVNFELKRK